VRGATKMAIQARFKVNVLELLNPVPAKWMDFWSISDFHFFICTASMIISHQWGGLGVEWPSKP